MIWVLLPLALLLGFLAGKLFFKNRGEVPNGAKSAQTDDFEALSKALAQAHRVNKSCREQLVHQERFAALGRLVAGIAHEIRNPLNFINNFAEITDEMIGECRVHLERERPNLPANQVEELRHFLEQLQANVGRIHHHGQRASGIVGRVLEQARDSAGKRRATDLNALIEEYADLCFYGLKARHPGKKQVLEKQLDADLPKVEVDPQDFSRAILNLIDNGFYAAEKRRDLEGAAFQPKVTVATKNNGNRVSIKISDNGMGIPENVKARIFEPFFTTKPVGEGTGLGLSISREIIEAHGGEIQITAAEGQGTEVAIVLPLKVPSATV